MDVYSFLLALTIVIGLLVIGIMGSYIVEGWLEWRNRRYLHHFVKQLNHHRRDT